MRKLAIISDLHADINQLQEAELLLLVEVLQDQAVTHVHLAGDTANHLQQLLEIVMFLEQQAFTVTYNFGNHEMPSLAGEEEIEGFADANFLNQRWLPLNEKQVLLSINGWYDYSFALEKDPAKILRTKNVYWYDRSIQRSGSDPQVEARILAELTVNLTKLAAAKKQVILATHFVPKKEFIVYQTGKYQRWNQLNAFLGSEKLGAVLDQFNHVQQVIFGHTHRRFEDKLIHGTRYSCRPFGYYYEWQLTRDFVLKNHLVEKYNPLKIRTILKNNQAAFQTYRKKHLKAEFAQGMTLIEY
ncbi:putative phosphoesterase [Enterococcus sp. PF1-24]|uniref:metallophosphoesterase n=1 Tax=unclassified Enterococcus TaxID=2608891 RepID=UPI002475DE12|nr:MULTISPECIES: metallophosphoesterase [unclassified Enterococcus]MDH6363816.1 putative phosphoesterase [Enterococcus sp. PFB1-1]MDH6400998.1 putative phosphoesterase [Enterococcus sp. PF1-24]